MLCQIRVVHTGEVRCFYVRQLCWSRTPPSVCLSDAGIVSKRLNMLSSPHDSPFILVLYVSRSSRNSDGVTPCGAAKQRWGMKISQFSTNNLLYLRNGWRQMGFYSEAFYKHWILFPTVWHLPRLSKGVPRGKKRSFTHEDCWKPVTLHRYIAIFQKWLKIDGYMLRGGQNVQKMW